MCLEILLYRSISLVMNPDRCHLQANEYIPNYLSLPDYSKHDALTEKLLEMRLRGTKCPSMIHPT